MTRPEWLFWHIQKALTVVKASASCRCWRPFLTCDLDLAAVLRSQHFTSWKQSVSWLNNFTWLNNIRERICTIIALFITYYLTKIKQCLWAQINAAARNSCKQSAKYRKTACYCKAGSIYTIYDMFLASVYSQNLRWLALSFAFNSVERYRDMDETQKNTRKHGEWTDCKRSILYASVCRCSTYFARVVHSFCLTIILHSCWSSAVRLRQLKNMHLPRDVELATLKTCVSYSMEFPCKICVRKWIINSTLSSFTHFRDMFAAITWHMRTHMSYKKLERYPQ